MTDVDRLFHQITDLATLEAAWRRVADNRGGPGGDGERITDFAAGWHIRLLRLQRDLRGFTYVPGPVRQVVVPKPDGGQRLLSIPCIQDRVAQTAAHHVLAPLLDPEVPPDSVGYRSGRSVRMAVDRIAANRRAGFGWVVDGDIEACFDAVPHDPLLDRLVAGLVDALADGRSNGVPAPDRPVWDPAAPPAVIDLVALWLDSFSPTGRGLPQGAPIAPLLSTLYLDGIDDAIASHGVRLVRFADDFVLMCRSEAAADAARDRIAGLLADHGLRLHPDKTRIVPFERGSRFLGRLFVHAVVVRDLSDDGDADLPLDRRALLPEDRALDAPRAEQEAARDPDGGHDGAPGLRVLYVTEPGRRLTARNRGFAVEEDGRELIAIPHRRVDRIELGPAVEADAAAVRLALVTGTAIAFVDGAGTPEGWLEPDPGRRAALHLAQARCALDPALRAAYASRLVDGRLRNQRALLHRLNRRRQDKAVAEALSKLSRVIRKLRNPGSDVPALMRIEGEAAALYWPALGRCLDHGWTFTHRRRRPPPDPVNLLLSFYAHLLHRDIVALILRQGLHPGFGCLHTPQDGQMALAHDLIEEFRAPLIEGLVVYHLNNRVLQPEHFQRVAMDAPADVPEAAGAAALSGPIRLTPSGRRAAIRGYEAWLDRPIRSPASGRTVAWRGLIDEQIGGWRTAVLAAANNAIGAESEATDAADLAGYSPYRMDY